MESKELAVKKSEVNIIDWLTYSWMHKVGKVGLDEFAANAYGIEGPFLLCESANDVEYYIEVPEKKDIDELDVPDLEEMLKTKDVPAYDLHTLLQDMVNKDLLPAGNYLVQMSW